LLKTIVIKSTIILYLSCLHGIKPIIVFSSRSFPQNPPISPPTIPAWQLETEETELGPDLVANTLDIIGDHEGKENQSANASSVSNTSEIEMINPDSQENSSEDGH